MQTYVALLRGINVGGKNMVAMAHLKGMFEALGHTGVTTYIQSGNVVFRSQATSETRLVDQLGRAIVDWFAVHESEHGHSVTEHPTIIAQERTP